MHASNPFAVMLSKLRHLAAPRVTSRLGSADVMLVAHDVDRSYRFRGQAYSPLLDSLAEELGRWGMRSLSVAKPYSNLHGLKAFGSPVPVNREAVLSSALRRIARSVAPDPEFEMWRRILRIVGPRAVMGIQPPAALCAACRSVGIVAVDLQHGVIDPRVYYNAEAAGAFGDDGHPQAVLCWDEPSAKQVTSALPGVRALVSGNPWLIRFADPVPGDELVADAEARWSAGGMRGSRSILVSLQWDPRQPKAVMLPDHVASALKALAGRGWDVLIRFHPVQLLFVRAHVLALAVDKLLGVRERRTWVDVTGHPLPLVLRQTSYHVTSHSAVALEAACFDIETGFWSDDPLLAVWFQEHLSAGTMRKLGESAEEIVRCVERNEVREPSSGGVSRTAFRSAVQGSFD